MLGCIRVCDQENRRPLITCINCIHNIIISFKLFIILFLTIIFVIKNDVVFCNSSDAERIEEDCMFVA